MPFCNPFAGFPSLSCDTCVIAGVQAMKKALKYYDNKQSAGH